MAIKLRMDLHPFGYGAKGHALMNISIHSHDRNPEHIYRIVLGNHEISGAIPKSRSGHRNPLHLLRDVIADVDLEVLGVDYVETPKAAKVARGSL